MKIYPIQNVHSSKLRAIPTCLKSSIGVVTAEFQSLRGLLNHLLLATANMSPSGCQTKAMLFQPLNQFLYLLSHSTKQRIWPILIGWLNFKKNECSSTNVYIHPTLKDASNFFYLNPQISLSIQTFMYRLFDFFSKVIQINYASLRDFSVCLDFSRTLLVDLISAKNPTFFFQQPVIIISTLT